jgi:hypothetical protein
LHQARVTAVHECDAYAGTPGSASFSTQNSLILVPYIYSGQGNENCTILMHRFCHGDVIPPVIHASRPATLGLAAAKSYFVEARKKRLALCETFEKRSTALTADKSKVTCQNCLGRMLQN